MYKKIHILLFSLMISCFFLLGACSQEQNTQAIEAQPATMPEPEPQRARLIFVGDIMAHDSQLAIAKKHGTPDEPYNFRPQFAYVKHLLQGDLVAGNFETVLSGQKPYVGYPNFNTPDSLAAALQEVNFNLLFLANNHILDRGIEAGHRTRDYLESQGFTTAGIGVSRAMLPIVDVNGLKIGFINRTYGTNVPIREKQAAQVHVPLTTHGGVADDVKALRDAGAHFVIASYHWGPEYVPTPSKAQQAAAAIALEAGVDAIIGHHPHILQPMEVIQTGDKTQFVAWSLGNFVSGQRTTPRERTVVLALDLVTDAQGKLGLEKVSVAPVWVDMVRGERLRLLPTRFGQLHRLRMPYPRGIDPAIFKEIQETPYLTNKLNAVDKAVVDFLKLPPADAMGFHTVWEKPAPASQPTEQPEQQTSEQASEQATGQKSGQTHPEAK